MVVDAIFGIVALLAGTLLMAFSSDKAVKYSVFFASSSGIHPLIIGFFLVSLGTDFPEIVNSVISSSLGHANINVGDSVGSVLTQLTLILGLLPFIGKTFKVKRREIITIGACEVFSLMLLYSIVEKGFISRINASFLAGSLPIYLLIINSVVRRSVKTEVELLHDGHKRLYYLAIAILGFVGVAVGAYAVVQSAIVLSDILGISEYLLSFFLLSIGTSLPELAVSLIAIRQRQYEVAIGDIVGSCVVDAGFSIGIGPLFFPQEVAAGIASMTTVYAMLASVIVIFLLALREKVDKKAGTAFILLYVASYLMLK